MYVPSPRTVFKKTTVGEWVTRPVRTLVQITRTIWRTITEAVPRFINRVRQVIDRIFHSEWVTTFKQVAKTFWEKVTEKVPLLGLFGKFLGFIWKTIFKPVIRWVTEAIRTLRTRVETIVRTIVEKIQDGWNYITKQISETIREWVEKTDWIREWVTKEISVPEIVWDMKFIPLPAMINTSTILSLLAAGTLTISLASMLGGTGDQGCGCKECPPTPTPNYALTIVADWATQTQAAVCVQIDMTHTAVAGTQTALAGTPLPIPTATATPGLNTDVILWSLANYIDAETSQYCQQQVSNRDTQRCQDLLRKVFELQDQYDSTILSAANSFHEKHPDIDPLILAVMYKRAIINEAQFVPGWVTGTEQGTGLAQITPDTLRTLAGQGLISIPEGYSDNSSLITLLHDPAYNAQAGMANLIYLHQGIVETNKNHGWQMSNDDVWKLTAAFYNSGPQSLVVHAEPDPAKHDFWEASRIVIQNNPDWYATYGCNNPADWDCLKYLFPNKDAEGRCTALYAESVAPDGISSNPTSTDILNTPPYNRQECAPQ